MKTILHVGCGRQSFETLPPFDFEKEWRQIRVDIDPSVKPDIVSSITDLSAIEANSVECVFSKHNIEHLEYYQVPKALSEFYRVLKPKGFLILRCPDLREVAKKILQFGLEDVLFTADVYSRSVDISLLDILYGARSEIESGNNYMAHRTGFTKETIEKKLKLAGFESVNAKTNVDLMELRCLALKEVSGNIVHSL